MPISTESRLVRCAIYTRKSTSAGLDAPVNSLDTQREVCRAYIKCQAHRNWVEVPQIYDDGGHSGGTLKRPALQRLIHDIETNRVDVVVIYKIDRLSRSLTDFVQLMDLLDKYGASFVSVTQTFDTSDSMGRLVLNILLTFAQFERELAAERIKDRYEERRRRGLYCGGCPPAGYVIKSGGRLAPDPERAETIRRLFLDFPEWTANALAKRLEAEGFNTKMYLSRKGKQRGGQKFSTGHILYLLRNPIYAGYCYCRGELVKAQVEPLVSLEQWELVQSIIKARSKPTRDPSQNFLLGLIHDELGRKMSVLRSGTGRSQRQRHYRSERATWALGTIHRKVMVNADRVEQLAVSTIQGFLTDRIALKKAVLSLGTYSAETGRMLRKGNLAARRISDMDKPQLRELFLAIAPRLEVNRSGLHVLVCTFELCRFLAWDGSGLFRKCEIRPKGSDRFRMLYAPAYLQCGHSYFAIPVSPCAMPEAKPRPDLVDLLGQATEFKQLLLDQRSKTVAELAHTKSMGATMFSRILRLNYLAPDIQASIIDGTQPADLTRHKILFGPLPLDWEQQRHLLGFPTVESPTWVDSRPRV